MIPDGVSCNWNENMQTNRHTYIRTFSWKQFSWRFNEKIPDFVLWINFDKREVKIRRECHRKLFSSQKRFRQLSCSCDIVNDRLGIRKANLCANCFPKKSASFGDFLLYWPIKMSVAMLMKSRRRAEKRHKQKIPSDKPWNCDTIAFASR